MARIVLILGALIIAAGAALMVQRYLAVERARLADAIHPIGEEPPPQIETVDVLIVEKDIAIAGLVSERTLAWQSWPEESLNDNYITRTDTPDAIEVFSGSAARQPLFRGEPVTEAKLVKPGTGGFLAAVLGRGRRAVTLKVDEAAGLAGLIYPGDRVDIVLTHQPPSLFGGEGGPEITSQQTAAETILRDLRILAIDQVFEQEVEKRVVAKTVTLEVDPQQAEVLALGRAMGRLSLVLRSAFGDELDERDFDRSFTRDVEISGVMAAARTPEKPRVLAATRRLPSGTLLTDRDLKWRSTEGPINAELHYLEGRDPIITLRGSLVNRTLAADQPIIRTQLIQPSDPSFVSTALRPGYRAISIQVEAHTAVTGFIGPGDLVDVLFTDTWEDERDGAILADRYFGETVARRVRVLSLKTRTDTASALQLPDVAANSTATLEVTPKQAERVTVATTMGQLTLILRAASEPLPQLASADPKGLALKGDGLDRASAAASDDDRPSFSMDTELSAALRALVFDPAIGIQGAPSRAAAAAGDQAAVAGEAAGSPAAAETRQVRVFRANVPETVMVTR